jgi:hypothetical protein
MLVPMIHQMLRRDDLWRLVAAISRIDAEAAQPAASALEEGRVDGLLDSQAALDAVRGLGGPPAALPLTLLWYIPVRAELRLRGVGEIDLADLTATLPVIFSSAKAGRRVARGKRGISEWTGSIDAMPRGTLGQAERAADCGAMALWWSGCFPEAVARRGGKGMNRAYVDFAAAAFTLAGRIVERRCSETGAFYHRAAESAENLVGALRATRRDYLGSEATTAQGRLDRFLGRLEGETLH